MFCRYCGTANPSDSRFCRICGKQLDGTTITLLPDSSTPVLPLPGIPMSGVQSAAENVPLVQGVPQTSDVPSVPGTPSSPGGHSSAASSTPLSSPAPQESLHTPHTSAPSAPSHITYPHPESHPHGYRPSHPPPEPHAEHPHLPPEPHPHAEHHPLQHTRPLTESHSRSTPLRSAASQQALSTGVRVAGQISRRALFIALGGAVAVTVGVGTVVYVNNAISTPEKTITTFLEAVKRRDGQTAFEQLSSRLQNQLNEQQYISNINLVGGFIGSYTISDVQESGSTAAASVSFTALILTANYSVELVNENGVWKIDGGTLINYY